MATQEQVKKPKGKHSLPMDREGRQTGKETLYAYTITDKAFRELKVLNSANAWWIDRAKVEALITAYKIDANNDEACFYAGITLDQLKYFRELHPEFSAIKHACRQHLGITAKAKFAKDVENNIDGAALTYLKMKRKDEGYTTRTDVTSGGEKIVQPNAIAFVDFAIEEKQEEHADEPIGQQ